MPCKKITSLLFLSLHSIVNVPCKESIMIVHLVLNIHEDFYNFVELLCPTSTITSGLTVAETLLMIFPIE